MNMENSETRAPRERWDNATRKEKKNWLKSLEAANAGAPVRMFDIDREGHTVIRDGKGYENIVLEPGLIAEMTVGKLFIKNAP